MPAPLPPPGHSLPHAAPTYVQQQQQYSGPRPSYYINGVHTFLPAPPGIKYLNVPLPGDRAYSSQDTPGTVNLGNDHSKGTMIHETGHQFDYAAMTPEDRNAFMHIMGLHGQWRQGANSPHEQFAEAYRIVAQHGNVIPGQEARMGGYELSMNPRQYQKVAALLLNVAARAGYVPVPHELQVTP